MKQEIQSLKDNKTWTLVDRPKNQRVIPCKWIYKIKRNEERKISRYKARLVTKDFNQVMGIDYEETFSPVVRSSTRSLIALAVEHGMDMDQLDVATAFLNGNLEERIYNTWNNQKDLRYRDKRLKYVYSANLSTV